MDLRHINKYCVALTAALGLGLASCSESDMPEQNDNTIKFAAKVQGKPMQANGKRMDVAVQANGKTYSYTLASDGSMTTQGEGLAWNGTDFDIKAWTPATDQSIDLTDQTTEDKLDACDLLAANGRAASHFVSLNFKHQMTRVKWNLVSVDESYTEEEVNAVRVHFYGYGSTKFTGGVVAPEGEANQLIAASESFSPNHQGVAMLVPADMCEKPLIKIEIGEDTYVYTPSKANDADMETAAGDLMTGHSKTYSIFIARHLMTVTTETTDVEWDNTHEFGEGDIADARLKADIDAQVSALPNYTVSGTDGQFVADRAAGFTITYTENAMGGLTWSGTCKVTRSENANTHTYTFTDVKSDVKVSYLAGVEVGDYVYDNGAWGKDADREGCKTVGRVFRVGLSDSDDSSYGLDKVRGYVAPVTVGGAEYKWFVNLAAADYLQALASIPVIADKEAREAYYGGCKLTGLLDAALDPFSAKWAEEVPFWNAFKGINLTAPAQSSGWYVPTIGQLKDILASGQFDYNGFFLSSQVYAGHGNLGLEEGTKDVLWAIRTNGTDVTYGWAIDGAKLLPVLTF